MLSQWAHGRVNSNEKIKISEMRKQVHQRRRRHRTENYERHTRAPKWKQMNACSLEIAIKRKFLFVSFRSGVVGLMCALHFTSINLGLYSIFRRDRRCQWRPTVGADKRRQEIAIHLIKSTFLLPSRNEPQRKVHHVDDCRSIDFTYEEKNESIFSRHLLLLRTCIRGFYLRISGKSNLSLTISR